LILMCGGPKPGNAIWMEPSLSSQMVTSTETVLPSSLIFIDCHHQTSPEDMQSRRPSDCNEKTSEGRQIFHDAMPHENVPRTMRDGFLTDPLRGQRRDGNHFKM
jgi:hypothetical protein